MITALLLATAFLTSPPVVAPSDTIKVTEADYRIYRSDGTPATFEDISEAMKEVDVVFVGESHNDPVGHYMELKILQTALKLQTEEGGKTAAFSMEMFTRDNQYILDEYLQDLISEKQFRSASQPWQNYETDYRPMVEFARVHKMDVIAANAPRRYTNRVSRLGRESLGDLSAKALSYIAPIPYGEASDLYREQWDKVMAEAMEEMMSSSADDDSLSAPTADGDEDAEAEEVEEPVAEEADEPGTPVDSSTVDMGAMMHGMGYLLDSQSLWDATMAYSIADYLLRHPGSLVEHIVGGFHVQTGTGIPEHLQKYRPGTRVLIVMVEPSENPEEFDTEEHTGLGDFVILSDESLPRTFDSE
jgi:uncharacterized iron-regulated protein